ncbi:MAG TPA: hypothetical protein VF179_07170 [Thermoanaerobaculia bacterium]|nr:hypothetical protein [Thermoanaerobaculia bacterium]
MNSVLLALLLAVQGTPPTVGDTIWVGRTVRIPAGYTVRAGDWEPADPFQLLGRPRVVISGDSAKITYPLVVWRPGRHVATLPGVLLLGPGGAVDSLPHEQTSLQVRSVLPAGDSTISPQPSAALVERHVVTLAPLVGLWAVTIVFLLPLHLWWRRRGKSTRAAAPASRPDALEVPLSRWADAGEHRAVASLATAQLRAALADRVPAAHMGLDTERVLAEVAAARPEWPIDEFGAVLRSLDDVRFGAIGSSQALGLSRSSMALRERLQRDAA